MIIILTELLYNYLAVKTTYFIINFYLIVIEYYYNSDFNRSFVNYKGSKYT